MARSPKPVLMRRLPASSPSKCKIIFCPPSHLRREHEQCSFRVAGFVGAAAPMRGVGCPHLLFFFGVRSGPYSKKDQEERPNASECNERPIQCVTKDI